MLKFWKKFRYFALGAVVMQFGGCPLLSNVLQDSITFSILEFLTDNNGIFDLFTDS